MNHLEWFKQFEQFRTVRRSLRRRASKFKVGTLEVSKSKLALEVLAKTLMQEFLARTFNLKVLNLSSRVDKYNLSSGCARRNIACLVRLIAANWTSMIEKGIFSKDATNRLDWIEMPIELLMELSKVLRCASGNEARAVYMAFLWSTRTLRGWSRWSEMGARRSHFGPADPLSNISNVRSWRQLLERCEWLNRRQVNEIRNQSDFRFKSECH